MRELFSSSRSRGKENVLYGLDARVKMFTAFTASVLVIPVTNFYVLTMLVCVSGVYAMLLRRFKVTFTIWTVIGFMMVIAAGFSRAVACFVPDFGSFSISVFLIPFLRIIVVANVLIVLALSSNTQSMFAALKSMRLPYYVYLPAIVMIRFIPGFIKDVAQVWESLKTRGYDLSPFMVCRKPFFFMRVLFFPVIVRALRTSDELGIAAEMKGVGLNGNVTVYKRKIFSRFDYAVVTAVLCIFFLAGICEYWARSV